MFMLGLFSWWYGAGWKGVLGATGRRLGGLAEMFSINILLRTLFSPWKRMVTDPGASLDAKIRAFGDNIVSRVVGFTVRFFVLFAAALAFVLLLLASLLELVVWPLVPVAGIALIVKGLL
jgi:hypothetical protein